MALIVIAQALRFDCVKNSDLWLWGNRAAMQFRDHPLISYRGCPSWPPVWSRVGREGLKTLRGEIVILKSIIARDLGRSTKCFLITEHEGEQYVGTLLISTPSDCAAICQFLSLQSGRSIREIGDLDVAICSRLLTRCAADRHDLLGV